MSAAPMRVAMVGLGRMGGPMADRVIRAGHDVRVVDVSAAAVAPRVAAGARAFESAAEACAGAQVVALVVFDDAQVVDVLTGTGGVLSVLEPGAVVVVHTTVTLDTIEALAPLAAARGVHLLDAGISGGEPGATAGTLVVMVGGDPAGLAAARPVLDTYSAELVHAGPQGTGMALKLARNAVGYMMMAAVHEGLRLATSAGVDADALRHVLEVTDLPAMIYTPFDIGGPEPLAADAPAELHQAMAHTVRLGRKDLAQALALADRVAVPMPAAVATRAEMSEIMRLGPSPT